MNFIERIAGLLVRPDEAMKDIARKPRIIEAFVIVFAYALLSVLSTIVSMSHTSLIINDPRFAGINPPENMKPFMMVFYSVITFIFTITLWPITAGVLHIFSKAFGGSGRFIPDMMAAIGYTYLIKIPAILIMILLLVLTPRTTMIYTPPPELGPNTTVNSTAVAFPLATSNATTVADSFSPGYTFIGGNILLTVVGDLVGAVGVTLSSLLGILAVKHGEGLRTRDAAIVVGVPLLIYLSFTLCGTISYYLMNAAPGTLTGPW